LVTVDSHELNWRKTHNILMPSFTKKHRATPRNDGYRYQLSELIDAWSRKKALSEGLRLS
jgi:hypothetical protein